MGLYEVASVHWSSVNPMSVTARGTHAASRIVVQQQQHHGAVDFQIQGITPRRIHLSDGRGKRD